MIDPDQGMEISNSLGVHTMITKYRCNVASGGHAPRPRRRSWSRFAMTCWRRPGNPSVQMVFFRSGMGWVVVRCLRSARIACAASHGSANAAGTSSKLPPQRIFRVFGPEFSRCRIPVAEKGHRKPSLNGVLIVCREPSLRTARVDNSARQWKLRSTQSGSRNSVMKSSTASSRPLMNAAIIVC